jgi:A/G-specific adenine glycosylase
LPDAVWRQAFRRRLKAWFDRHARDLPWRRTRDPYAIWLSEVMLQQTQVATVIPYFERFTAAFPTIQALAEADEQQVLRLWEGLGYYRRARQLHRAAQVIVAEHGGVFPRDPQAVRRLPGIGRYTAGAILSIAFDAREPILEANTVRLFSRLLAYRGNPTSAEGQSLLWAMAEAVLPRSRANGATPSGIAPGVGRLNQALMELGGQVCDPRTPCCNACPVASLCEANRRGLQQEVPCRKTPPRWEAVREAAVLVRRRGRVLLLRWPEGRRWAGLWDFPRFPVSSEQPAALHRELVENVKELTGVIVSPGDCIKTLTHGVTRFRITLDCYQAEYVACAESRNGDEMETRWAPLDELADYPLSSTGRRLSRLAHSK